MDLRLVEVADVVLRLPGVSPGGDRECDWANGSGVKVCYGWVELETFLDDLAEQTENQQTNKPETE